jgi:hypothetical protein
MTIYKYCIVFSVLILFLIQIATAQQPAASGLPPLHRRIDDAQ